MLKLKLGNLALVSALAFVPTGTIGTYTGNQAEKLVFEISKEQGENIEFKTKLEIAKDILNEAEEIKQKRMLEEINKSLKEAEELKRKEEEAKQELNETFVLTFYTSLDYENGYGDNVTASGHIMGDEIILASNVYPLGTKVELEGYGVLTILDRGGSNFNNSSRFDVYIPREVGESESHYYKRVNNMGRVTVKGRILNK